MQEMTLRNGVLIPSVGFGTWRIPAGETAVRCVSAAIAEGYRHIDGAALYKNEPSVGDGIRAGLERAGISRADVFVTSKVWNTERGYEKTLKAFEKTLSDLGLDYLDLYLIHWPANGRQYDDPDAVNLDTWRALTELYKTGKVRAIGTANFKPHHLAPLMETEVAPMVNQIEFHPGTMWEESVKYCKANGILVEAWSPLGSGRILEDERLREIAARYGKSVARICLRWILQHDILPLPRSTNEKRIAENLDVFGFELADDDMTFIDSLPPFGGSGNDPDEVDF